MTGGSAENPLHKAALEYAKRGWPVFPLHTPVEGGCSCIDPNCKPGSRTIGKHPRTTNGFKNATTDPAQIDRWWKRWPDANIGIATGAESGLVVLDVDPDKGGDDSLMALEVRYGDLPDTPTVATGGGGRHFYFAHPGGRVPSTTGFEDGLDRKADGGYVVAPPSLHESGRRYEWTVV